MNTVKPLVRIDTHKTKALPKAPYVLHRDSDIYDMYVKFAEKLNTDVDVIMKHALVHYIEFHSECLLELKTFLAYKRDLS